jgi:hypothetical protein
MCAENCSRSRLRVVAHADPGVIARVLERFQNMNVLPRRIHAELGSNGVLHIELDVFGIDGQRRRFIAAGAGRVRGECLALPTVVMRSMEVPRLDPN